MLSLIGTDYTIDIGAFAGYVGRVVGLKNKNLLVQLASSGLQVHVPVMDAR